MYLERFIDRELSNWKNSSFPKPLLVRGARQVGKTESIRNLGKQFAYFVEINFESEKKNKALFEGNLTINEITESISAIYQKPIKKGETLIFLDEIQSCPEAIQSLRFFYEQYSGLHVVAAGSLLEFALSEIPSFGVGRIRSVFMYPFSFDEFLLAMNESKLLEMKKKATPQNPLNAALHEKLLQHLRKFLILGGMPEVVSNYQKNGDLYQVQLILNDLKISYFDDFAKYKDKVPAQRIRHVYNAVAMQMGSKFVYSRTLGEDNHRQIKEALELLILSGIVIPVSHSSANGIPLGAEVNPKKRKMLLSDTGLYLNMLNLDLRDILTDKDFAFVNKGAIAELFVGLELLKYQSPYEKSQLFYWHREARGSNSELDYLITKGFDIIPMEVKSGTKGSMQSMHLFLESKGVERGIRISSENYSSMKQIDIYPLYAVSSLV